MIRIAARVRGEDGARGVYSILYAGLVLVMIGMAAIVVDLAMLRQSRRDNRSAADSAAIAGASFLNSLRAGGMNPRAACEAAWSYLEASIVGLTKPAGVNPCNTTAPNNFPTTSPANCASTQYGGPVLAGGGGGYYVTVSWPVPKTSAFMNPDQIPARTQTFNAAVDGADAGCDRIGIAIEHRQRFLLGSAIGPSRGTTVSSSVARIDPDGGRQEEVAALNVLNKTDCQSLVTLGGGKVLVAPTIDNGEVVGPGIIAVEANGNGTCSGPNDTVIAPNTSSGGSLICASSVDLNSTGSNCDGLGLIRSHALDPGGRAAYSETAITNGNLKPRPLPENGRSGWNPVTKRYGCSSRTPVLSDPCGEPAPPTNYIRALETALGGTGKPTSNYASSVAPYTSNVPFTYPTTFDDVPAGVCANITTQIVLASGKNHYANCHINIGNGGQLIVQGGTLVIQGGISIGSGGCFVMNGTTCSPTIVGTGTSTASTSPPPQQDAIIYMRGVGCPNTGCFNTSGKTIMPQTFVYSANERFTVNSTDVTLWTAPGAGPVTADTTALERHCTDSTGTLSEDCLDSRFSRLAYWSEFAAPRIKPNDFAGQGALSVVGVFFIPRAYFDVSGGGAYTAAAAQFWADQIRVNGGAFLGLRPDARTALPTPTSAVALIR